MLVNYAAQVQLLDIENTTPRCSILAITVLTNKKYFSVFRYTSIYCESDSENMLKTTPIIMVHE